MVFVSPPVLCVFTIKYVLLVIRRKRHALLEPLFVDLFSLRAPPPRCFVSRSGSSGWRSFSNDFQGFMNSYLAGFETCALFDLENPSLQVKKGGFVCTCTYLKPCVSQRLMSAQRCLATLRDEVAGICMLSTPQQLSCERSEILWGEIMELLHYVVEAPLSPSARTYKAV